MSDHLPECDATDCGCTPEEECGPNCICGCTPEEECGPNCINLCICDRLRAAEQRVRDELPPNGADALWYLLGQRKGVQAARDAVAARCQLHHRPQPFSACPGCTEALAAIDGVKP